MKTDCTSYLTGRKCEELKGNHHDPLTRHTITKKMFQQLRDTVFLKIQTFKDAEVSVKGILLYFIFKKFNKQDENQPIKCLYLVYQCALTTTGYEIFS